MVVTLVKICLFLASCAGYWSFFQKKTPVDRYFVPAFTVAVQFLLLFAAGILNFLEEMAFALYGFGLFLVLRELYRERLTLIRSYLEPGYLFLMIAAVLVTAAVRGREFIWQDTFSHWGLVTGNMLRTGGFPNFADEVITFQNYPLGSSAYIYYFCRMTSPEESIQMAAQGFLMLQLILPLFAYAGKRRWLCAGFLALLTNFLFCYNIPLTELMVDTLLPLAGMTAVLFIHRHYLWKREAETEISLYYAVPLLCYVMQIKNSGIFFLLFAAVLLAVQVKRDRRNLRPVLAAAGCVLLCLFLWSRHCDYVYPNASYSKHALTTDYMQLMVSDKSAADVGLICAGILQYMLTRRELLWLVLWLAVPGILAWTAVPSMKQTWGKTALFAAAMYVVYGLGQMGMYVFSMPRVAALALECLDRYTKTIDIAIWYVLAAFSLQLLSRLEGRKLAAAAAAVLALTAGTWYALTGGFDHIFRLPKGSEMRTAIESPVEEYGVLEGYSYMVCAPKEYADMPYFILKYRLDSPDVLQLLVTEESQMEAEKDYDYIIILDEDNPVITRWVAEHYPDQQGRPVIQCLK